MMKTLADFLKTAGVNVAPPTPAAAPAAPAKTAGKASPDGKGVPAPAAASQPADKGGEKTPRATSDKKAAVEYDPAVITTPEQLALLEAGIVIPDAKLAAYVYAQQVEVEKQTKQAEVEVLAEEERAKGALQYHGMVKESTAMRFATGELDVGQVIKVASMIGINPADIVKRAEQLAAATAAPALVDGHLGTAARITSAVQAAAENNANTTEFRPEGAAGTRQPVSGQDEKLIRFTDKITLPGNPGLNHGQQVDQGKGYAGVNG